VRFQPPVPKPYLAKLNPTCAWSLVDLWTGEEQAHLRGVVGDRVQAYSAECAMEILQLDKKKHLLTPALSEAEITQSGVQDCNAFLHLSWSPDDCCLPRTVSSKHLEMDYHMELFFKKLDLST